MDQQLYQNLKAEFAKTPADLPTIGKLVQALMVEEYSAQYLLIQISFN